MMSKLLKLNRLLLFALCLGNVSIASGNDIMWHGFLSQGVMHASGNNYISDDGGTTFKLTEVGINGTYRFDNGVRISGQVVYVNAGNRFNEAVNLDYLILQWPLYTDMHNTLDVKLGRVKNYHWLYSATADVPFTRASIVLPQGSYPDSFRDLVLSQDGITLSGNHDFSNFNLSWDWSYGVNSLDNSFANLVIGSEVQGDVDQDFVHQFGFKLRFLEDSLLIGANYLDSDFAFDGVINGIQTPADATSERPWQVMLQYSIENIELSVEAFEESVSIRDSFIPILNRVNTGRGWYSQVRWFLNEKVTFMARYEDYYQDKNDKSGRLRELFTGIPAHTAFWEAATFGATWHITPNIQLHVEHHEINGTGRLGPLLIPNPLINDSKSWSLTAAELTYRF